MIRMPHHLFPKLKTIKTRCYGLLLGSVIASAGLLPLHAHAGDGRFQDKLDESIGNAQANQNLPERFQKYAPFQNAQYGIAARDFIIFIGLQVMIPVFIFVGILFALVGFYKIMTSTSADETKKWTNYLLRGVVWTLLMVAAAYIAWLLTGTEWAGGIFGTLGQSSDPNLSGVELAQNIYQKLVFPVLKLVMYLGIGLLFIMVLLGSFQYLFSWDEEAQKGGLNMLLYSAAGIIIMILAKTIVEVVYGKYADVVNKTNELKNLGLIGKGSLAETDFGIFYVIMNRIIGIWTFIIIIVLVYQGYVLLTNPGDDDKLKTIQQNFVYIFIGILVLGAAYLIVNFFIIN